MPQIDTYEIPVLDKGIHCPGCEVGIQRVLSKLPGIKEVKASYKSQIVSVTLDPEEVTGQEIREKLEDMGYKT